MKSLKLVLLSAVLTLGVFFAVFYTSCSKDSCKAVTCINGGTCGGGLCNCKDGTGGLNCEVIYRNIYANTYKGSGGPDDSGRLYHNNTFTFVVTPDSTYTTMQLTWTNPGVHTVTFPLTLLHNASSGSTFSLASTPVDTFTFTGTGSVSASVASITLTETHPHSTPVIITLNNFVKQ
jgi:hypothetical protein